MTGKGPITTLSGMPWVASDAPSMDLDYIGNRSGNKWASPMVEKVDDPEKIAKVIESKYKLKWSKLWATLSFEYNPIENYDMIEEGQDSRDNTRTPNLQTTTETTPDLTHTESITDTPGVTETEETTRTPNITENENTTRTPNLTDKTNATRAPNTTGTTTVTGDNTNTTRDKYGFNKADAAPYDKETVTHSSTTSVKETGTETNTETRTQSGTDANKTTRTTSGDESTNTTRTRTGADTRETTTKDSGTNTETVSATGNEQTTEKTTHKLTRHGNIGVTSSQQLIESERNLWFWDFWEQVFSDLDSILTIPLY